LVSVSSFSSFSMVIYVDGAHLRKMCGKSFSLFFVTFDSSFILLSDGRKLCLQAFKLFAGFPHRIISFSRWFQLASDISTSPFLSVSNRFLSALITLFSLVLIRHLLVCHNFRSFPFSASLSFIVDKTGVWTSILQYFQVICYAAPLKLSTAQVTSLSVFREMEFVRKVVSKTLK